MVLDLKEVDIVALFVVFGVVVIEEDAGFSVSALPFEIHSEFLKLGNFFTGHELLPSCALEVVFLDAVGFSVAPILQTQKLRVLQFIDLLLQLLKLGLLFQKVFLLRKSRRMVLFAVLGVESDLVSQ